MVGLEPGRHAHRRWSVTGPAEQLAPSARDPKRCSPLPRGTQGRPQAAQSQRRDRALCRPRPCRCAPVVAVQARRRVEHRILGHLPGHAVGAGSGFILGVGGSRVSGCQLRGSWRLRRDSIGCVCGGPTGREARRTRCPGQSNRPLRQPPGPPPAPRVSARGDMPRVREPFTARGAPGQHLLRRGGVGHEHGHLVCRPQAQERAGLEREGRCSGVGFGHCGISSAGRGLARSSICALVAAVRAAVRTAVHAVQPPTLADSTYLRVSAEKSGVAHQSGRMPLFPMQCVELEGQLVRVCVGGGGVDIYWYTAR